MMEELVFSFNYFFDNGEGEEDEKFTEIFNSVLVDLPQDVFEKLSKMKNLFFQYSAFPATGSVRRFYLEDALKQGDELIIVTFDSSLDETPRQIVRWLIAHEIAHIYLGHSHEGTIKKREDEANELAKIWGFQEIATVLVPRKGDWKTVRSE